MADLATSVTSQHCLIMDSFVVIDIIFSHTLQKQASKSDES